jgi:hypothetical protein
MSQKVYAKIVFTRPVLQNELLLDDLSGKKKAGSLYNPEEEAEKRTIRNSEGLLCQKAIHLEKALVKSATQFKMKGRKTYKEPFQAGVFVSSVNGGDPFLIPHSVQEYDIDSQAVCVSRARIIRHRPLIPAGSELEFQIEIRDDRIEPVLVQDILEDAGKYGGIGDYRPRYGLFDLVEFEVLTE